LDKIDAVFVSLGGGGLISGLSGYLKKVYPDVKIIGCSPENSPVMVRSIRAGEILDMESQPTLSDGTAGGVEQGAITFDLCKKLVDDFILVTEEEIAESMRLFVEKEHLLIEGAAAVAVAGFLKQKNDYRDQKVVIIICGGNIGLETFKKIL
jgi:threonine dehydratase